MVRKELVWWYVPGMKEGEMTLVLVVGERTGKTVL